LSLGVSFVAFALSTEMWMAVLCIALAGLFEIIYLATNQTLI
jgi:hypothetical protein